jgi:hypothetical protein
MPGSLKNNAPPCFNTYSLINAESRIWKFVSDIIPRWLPVPIVTAPALTPVTVTALLVYLTEATAGLPVA